MTKADELWEKHGNAIDGNIYMGKSGFLAALAEYGKAVRDGDAEICRETGGYADDCAAAISREPLP